MPITPSCREFAAIPGVELAYRGHELRDIGVLRLVDRGEDALDHTLIGLFSVAGRAEHPIENAAEDGYQRQF